MPGGWTRANQHSGLHAELAASDPIADIPGIQ
jgi:hypothetical protein